MKNMMQVLTLPLLVIALTLAAPSARAVPIFTGGAVLDGAQEVPPNASPATGFAVVKVDDNDDADPATNTLYWDVHFQGLVADFLVAHFHAPALPGFNAPVRVDITASLVGVPATSGELLGSASISAAFVNGIRAGLWYVNVHTQTFPGGEIRGQVIPEPGLVALIGLGLACLALYRRRTR